MVRATEFIRQIEGKTQAINQVLDAKSHLQVLKNREVVKSIAKTVTFQQSKTFHSEVTEMTLNSMM